jgi:hypothetical protein
MNTGKQLKDLLPQPISEDLLAKVDALTINQKSQLVEALNAQLNQTYIPQQTITGVVKFDG